MAKKLARFGRFNNNNIPRISTAPYPYSHGALQLFRLKENFYIGKYRKNLHQ